jgi:hypothetical protein
MNMTKLWRLPIVAALILAALIVAMAACMVKGSGGKLSPPPVLPQMGGSWDFTVIGGNGNPVEVDANLTENTLGNLSATSTVSASGPGTDLVEVDIFGSSLSTATDMAIGYLGNTCSSDNGNRSLTGTINASSHVALTYDVGGSFTVTIDGTFNASATPPFSGSFTVSAPGCQSDGQTGTVTGVLASSFTGSYSGTSASDSTETITMTLTEMNGGFSGSGNDNKNGDFTILANVVANVFGGNITGPGSPVNNGAVFGYFDPQLGSKGSILLTSFQGGSATACPNGVPIDNGSCLIAILALQ